MAHPGESDSVQWCLPRAGSDIIEQDVMSRKPARARKKRLVLPWRLSRRENGPVSIPFSRCKGERCGSSPSERRSAERVVRGEPKDRGAGKRAAGVGCVWPAGLGFAKQESAQTGPFGRCGFCAVVGGEMQTFAAEAMIEGDSRARSLAGSSERARAGILVARKCLNAGPEAGRRLTLSCAPFPSLPVPGHSVSSGFCLGKAPV